MCSVEAKHFGVGHFRKLERRECIDEHEASKVEFVMTSAEYILVEQEVSAKEEDESFSVDHLWVINDVDKP